MNQNQLVTQLNAGLLSRGIVRDKPIVLHVDDDPASLVMAEGSLEDASFEVVQASDGLEAIEKFQACEPDIIIMDAVMPNMDGFDAISHIRKTALGAHVPILMITGLDDLDSITRAYDEGATDFLTKPINFFILPHRVQYMLRSRDTADKLRSSQAKLDNAQRIARLGHWEWTIETDEFFWSKEFARILKFPDDQFEGHLDTLLEAIDSTQRGSVKTVALQAVAEAREFSVEFTIAEENDDLGVRSIRLEAEPNINDAGVCTHMLGTMQDITERKNAQKQIHDLAYYDLVTGLPNRAQLNEKLNYALKLAERTQTKFGLLFLDLDHFKQVNDTLGHDAGDDLLRQVSDRLSHVLRDSDMFVRASATVDNANSKHLVARLGGDEFVVLLGQINQAEDAARVAERIANSIGEPYNIGDIEVAVTTTIGISVYPADGRDSETLMKHADVAMYHAKEQGRNGYQFYSKGIHEKALARFAMERELKQAIENEQLQIVYQPKIDLVSGATSGVEALVRWNHPEKGPVSPADFIPLAEETGLILPLGQWVLTESCKQMQRWIEKGIGPFSVAVNCSPVQFTRGNMIRDIDSAIEQSGLDPRHLEVELTESLFLHNIEKGIQILKSMKELGIKIAVDDFGTGFSSLSYLKRLPVDKLKIDQSFVKELDTDKGDAAIVSAIITLSHNLNLSVVAEGVENVAQLNVLQEQRCNEVQGYFISYPLTPDEFENWITEKEADSFKKASGL